MTDPTSSTTRTALARVYRPRRFGEMAMQEHVSETLKAAVSRGRVAHAYLFAGPRGVGKTTAARILAMALNCPQRAEDGEPCGSCESCERIWSGRTSLDVVEIDAASNRGVDDARELRERAMYAPTAEGRYKVYIIDEAHMLTREAWNALLKILEEPPPRVIFCFATTEPQKIQQAAPPILSRCQRFDFRRIGTAAIVARLREVLAREGVEAGDDALVPIARRADGGLRDALSLLDQVLSFAGPRLGAEEVRRLLGLVGEELYLELFEIVAARRHADVFRFVERVLDEGYDLAEFYRGLADALRALLVAKLDGPDAPDVREDLRPAYAARAADFAVGDLLRMLARVAELDADGALRKSANPRLLLEALLLRFAHLDRTVELEDLIRAATGGAGPPGASGGGPPPRPGSSAAAGGAAREPSAPPYGAASHAPPSGSPRAEPRRGEPAPARPAAGESAGPATGDAPSGRRPEPPPGDPRAAAGAALRALVEAGKGPAGLAIFLKVAEVVEASGDRVVVELPPGPGLERLTGEPPLHAALASALGAELGRRIALEVRPRGGAADAPPQRFTPDRVRSERLERMAREEPLLARAVEELDLELLD